MSYFINEIVQNVQTQKTFKAIGSSKLSHQIGTKHLAALHKVKDILVFFYFMHEPANMERIEQPGWNDSAAFVETIRLI